MGPIVPFLDRLPSGCPLVARIGAKMLRCFRTGCRSGADYLVERRRQEFHVMHVGPARDERQRENLVAESNRTVPQRQKSQSVSARSRLSLLRRHLGQR